MSVASLVRGKAAIYWPRDMLGVTCILIESILGTVGNSAPISPTGVLDWASIQSLLLSA